MNLNEKKVMKKSLSILVVFTLLLSCMLTNLVGAAELTLNTPLTLNRSISDSSVMVNQPFTVSFEVTPETVSVPEELKPPKEIYIVIDTSGSMNDNLNGSQRIAIAKSAATTFIDNISKLSNVKAGLISFDNTATLEKTSKMTSYLTNNFAELKKAVNNLSVGGGTNIGDGLRKAYFALRNSGNAQAEKYIVLLTDGAPTYYSQIKLNGKNVFYVTDDREADYTTGGNGSDTTSKEKKYCYTIAELIKPSNIKTYVIGFTNGANEDILKTIEQKSGGVYKKALDSNALNQVYNEINNEITNDITLKDVTFEETIPSGIELVSAPAGFAMNGQTLSGKLPPITYTYNKDTKQYKASKVTFDVTFKGTVANSYVLGSGYSSKLSYKALDGSTKQLNFGELSVIVSDLSAPITLSRTNTISGEIKVNNLFDINYKVKPEPMIIDNALVKSNKKEIVVVVDTSSSMTKDLNGNYTSDSNKQRITIVKKAASEFVGKLEDVSDVKIAVVTYNEKAVQKIGLSTDITKIKEQINKATTYYGTNIGDGLRTAYNILNAGDIDAKKYIVLLTDGDPTEYSTDNSDPTGFYLGGGASTTTENDYSLAKGTEYCNVVVDKLINKKDINNYYIAFSTKDNMLKGLAQKANGQFKEASDATGLNIVYEEISKVIKSEYVVKNVKFSETFPTEITIDSADPKLTVSGGTITGNLGDIPYTYDSSTGKYVASEINFTIKAKGNTPGTYSLNNSTLSYVDVDGENEVKPFPNMEITIEAKDDEDPYIPNYPGDPETDIGPAALKVTNVEKVGEKAVATVKITLPTGTLNYKVINTETGENITVTTVGSTNKIEGIDIYKTLKGKMQYTLPDGTIGETAEVIIYRKVDVN